MSVSVEGSNWRDVEVGRVVLFQGDHLYTGRLAAIVGKSREFCFALDAAGLTNEQRLLIIREWVAPVDKVAGRN